MRQQGGRGRCKAMCASKDGGDVVCFRLPHPSLLPLVRCFETAGSQADPVR